MADEAPTYEQQTADFVIETAEQTLKEKTPDADETKTADTKEGATEEVAQDDKADSDAGATDAGATDDAGGDGDAEGDKSDAKQGEAGKRKLTAAQRHAEIQARTNELTRQLRETERQVAAALERLDTSKKGGLTDKVPDTTVSEGDAPPDPAKFEYGELDGRYIEAKIAHGVTKALKAKDAEAETKRQADAAAARQQEMQQKYQTFEEAGTKKYDDFNDVVVESAKSGLWKPTPVLAELILTSPEGPDVAYHLASNLKEAREISGKSPLEQAAWFGRTAATFSPKPSGAATPKVVKTTQAPPVPKSSAKGAGVNPGFDPATADFSSFEAEVMRKK